MTRVVSIRAFKGVWDPPRKGPAPAVSGGWGNLAGEQAGGVTSLIVTLLGSGGRGGLTRRGPSTRPWLPAAHGR